MMLTLIDSQACDTIVTPANETAGKDKFEAKNCVSDKDVELKADE